MALKIVAMVALFVVAYAAVSEARDDQAANIYNSIPDDEKKAFLMYQLARALEGASQTRPAMLVQNIDVSEMLRNKFQNMNVPSSVTESIYNWIAGETNYNRDEMTELALRGKKCGPPCHDLNNPGSNCC